MSKHVDLHKFAREGRTDELENALNLGDMTKSISLVNVTDKHRRTPLHLAAFFGHPESVTKLIEYKANIHTGAVDGFTALHFAAQNGHLEVCKILLSAKANIDRATDRGVRTPLHLAAFKGKTDVMEYLIRRKANTEKRNSDGKTALDLVSDESTKTRLVELIEQVEERKNVKRKQSDGGSPEQGESKVHKLDDNSDE
jgi:ankyrin repeat protein